MKLIIENLEEKAENKEKEYLFTIQSLNKEKENLKLTVNENQLQIEKITKEVIQREK